MVRFSLLYKYNLIFTSILFLCFLFLNSDYSLMSLFLSFFGAISSAVILYIVLYVLLFSFSFIGKIGLYIVALGFLFVDIALIVDFFIFRLYNFHINAMVLNILTSPAASDSIQLGIVPFLAFITFLLSLFVLQFYIVNSLFQNSDAVLKHRNKAFNKTIIMPLFLIVLGEKISYGFASLFSKNDVLNAFRVIPLYQPLTFNKIAAKHFGFKFEKKVQNTISSNSSLKYPKKNLEFKDELNKVNIFIIASDAVNANMINSEITPNIEEFKKESLVFNNHYSGGNSTRFGIFSLLYGLNSTYWFSFLNEHKGAVLFDVLKEMKYDINIVSSTDASWPEFRKTAYINVLDSLYDKFDGSPWQKDKQSSDKTLELISKMDISKPQFTFLFMDAPHGYSYPKEFNKFNASSEEINYLTLEKNSKDLNQVKKTYKNSIAYNDKLFADIIKKLKQRGLYDNSIIIYTSDHGKEFFEYGFFGHNSSFSQAQTKVPFILKLPNQEKNKQIDKMTSHLDVVPSLLSYIGVKNDYLDYSNGKSFFDKDFNRNNVFIANWNNNAITTKDYTYVFSNLPNKMFKNEIRLNSTYEKLGKKYKANSSTVLSIMNQNRHFYK